MVASTPRAWSLIALDPTLRQYGGNTGYDDQLASTYRYDADVANHKQLAIGDLVLIRDSKRLIGIAQIETISSFPVQKIRQRCPTCGQVNVKLRKTKPLPWRCVLGHEFQTPLSEEVTLKGYAARYEQTFVPAPEAISVVEIKNAALRPNDQLSIEEVDLSRFEHALVSRYPETRLVIERFLDGKNLAPEDAALPADFGIEADTGSPFLSTMSDTRERVLRSIRLRRGQSSFRNSLILRYGPHCMASGCSLMDIVEAAHIDPFRGINDHHPENGLLLRTDLHTLFDLNLMGIEPDGLILRFHPRVLNACDYRSLDGTPLQLPAMKRPAEAPIKRRWAAYRSK